MEGGLKGLARRRGQDTVRQNGTSDDFRHLGLLAQSQLLIEVNGGHKGLWTEAISSGAAWPVRAKLLASNLQLPANQDLDGWCRATWDPRCPPTPALLSPLVSPMGGKLDLIGNSTPSPHSPFRAQKSLCPCSLVVEKEVGAGKNRNNRCCHLRRRLLLRPCEYDAVANGRCNRSAKQNFLCVKKRFAEIRAALNPPRPARFDAAVVLICIEAVLRSARRGERGFKEALVSVLLIYRLEPTTK